MQQPFLLSGYNPSNQGLDGIPFDNSNFPALSSQAVSSNRNISLGGNPIGNQLLSSQNGNYVGEFVVQKDDFPALNSVSSLQHASQSFSSEKDAHSRSGSIGSFASVTESHAISSSSADTVSKDVRYGLLGLLEAIRMADKDLNALALGSDLTAFGLNLNSSECLYADFVSPLPESASTLQAGDPATPPFQVPMCYLIQPPKLSLDQFSKLQLETLFYMFYALPKDLFQALASQELYKREWRYHKDLRIWIKARTPTEQAHSHAGVAYIYFELNSWDIKPLNPASLSIRSGSDISSGLLTEDEVRVTQSLEGVLSHGDSDVGDLSRGPR